MTPDIFAEWFRRQGQRVIQTASSYWVETVPHVFQAFPYHWVISPSDNELTELLKAYNGVVLRYSTPLNVALGSISYHAVYESSDYDIHNLGKWARKNVRRGLSRCQVEPISFERLAHEGFELQIDTLARQGRKLNLAKESWQMLCMTAGELPGFEAWGALVQGRLAASVITFQMENFGYMLYQQCHHDDSTAKTSRQILSEYPPQNGQTLM